MSIHITLLSLAVHLSLCYSGYNNNTLYDQFLVFLDCEIPVGMRDGRIGDSQITASSHHSVHFPNRGRLHNKTTKEGNTTKWGAWCADGTDSDPYLQVGTSQTKIEKHCEFTRAIIMLNMKKMVTNNNFH